LEESAGRTGNPFFTTRSMACAMGIRTTPFWLVHPAVTVQHLVFFGANGLQIEKRSLLQLWMREELRGIHANRFPAFAGLEIVEQSHQ
jgi:hypothetical protein